MAATLLREISKDERERAIFRSRRMAETDRISDLLTAEEKGERRSDKKWKKVVAKKDAALADNKAVLAEKDAEIASIRAENARLRADLGK